MKLYATVSSERASKGQGGNKFLKIEIKLNDRFNNFATLFVHEDGEIELSNMNGVIVYKNNAVEFSEEGQDCKIEGCMGASYPCGYCKRHCTHETHETKGKRQKGECEYAHEDTNYCETHKREH